MKFFCALLTIVLLSLSGPVLAEEGSVKACLDKAERLPDIASAEAELWLKKGGGDNARLCLAFADFHRGAFRDAGNRFADLARVRETKDRRRAVSLHSQAALSYMRAGDTAHAEAEYAAAIRLEPQDPDIYMDRATERASIEKYWEALDDLKIALRIMPDMSEALRLRGQIWRKLGLDTKARADFYKAERIDAPPSSVAPQSRAKTK